MAKTANITIRIDPETKTSAEQLFSSFGITITDEAHNVLLLVDGIGPDIMSDIISNICKDI